jgi:hypothetical protein
MLNACRRYSLHSSDVQKNLNQDARSIQSECRQVDMQQVLRQTNQLVAGTFGGHHHTQVSHAAIAQLQKNM